MGGTIPQIHEVEQFFRTFAGLFTGNTGDIGRNHDILERRELR